MGLHVGPGLGRLGTTDVKPMTRTRMSEWIFIVLEVNQAAQVGRRNRPNTLDGYTLSHIGQRILRILRSFKNGVFGVALAVIVQRMG